MTVKLHCIFIKFLQFFGKHVHHLLRISAQLIDFLIVFSKLRIHFDQFYDHFRFIYTEKRQPCVQLIFDTFIVQNPAKIVKRKEYKSGISLLYRFPFYKYSPALFSLTNSLSPCLVIFWDRKYPI